MKPGRPLWIAVAAALAGSICLAVWFQPSWPASSWRVLPRSRILDRANQVAGQFGVNTNGWSAQTTTHLSQSLARYANQHPSDPDAQAVSPLSLRIRLAQPHADENAEVGLDSSGRPVYWRAPNNVQAKQAAVPEEQAAQQAFQFLAGAEAAAYGSPIRSAGENSGEEEYLWKKALEPHSEVRDRIRVVTRNASVATAEHKTYLTFDDGSESHTGDGESYWEIIDVAVSILCTLTVLIIFGLHLLWWVRKALNRKMQLRAGIAAGLLLLVIGVTNQHADVAKDLTLVAILISSIAVGRSISGTARPKWFTLEQLFFLAPKSKCLGRSLGAGILFSPLLLAIPFVVAGSRLFPETSVIPHNLDFAYSRSPFLASIALHNEAYLLGFFGFGVPIIQRFLRWKWLSSLILLPIGVFYFADIWQVLAGPYEAPLVGGFLTLLLFWFVYNQFDILAALTLQLTSGLLLTTVAFTQKSLSTGLLIPALGAIGVVAYLFVRSGEMESTGDPLATVPTFAGFRAEREKLRAEFSVARRAQQDMLPQTPPHVPGYSIAASCIPSLEVGGDLYDFLKLADGRIGIGVADVSGKGVPAALYMTLTKGLLAAVTNNSSQLLHVMDEVNRHLHGVTRKKVFVTMALGFLDAEKRVLECVRAGHNPVVWRQKSKSQTTLVAPKGLGLGITGGRIFATQLKVEQLELSGGDAVVFYSDGITEAMNSGLEQFGEQRLMDAVEQTDDLDAAKTRDSILNEVRAFLGGVHPQDDMTLVVLRVEG